MPSLRQLIWWYNLTNEGDDFQQMTDIRMLRKIDGLVFQSQVPRFAEVGVDLTWQETRTLEETSFGFAALGIPPSDIEWREVEFLKVEDGDAVVEGRESH